MIEDLFDENSPLVLAALQRGCPICKSTIGEPCHTLTGKGTLLEAFGYAVHRIRADGIKYGSAEKMGRQK